VANVVQPIVTGPCAMWIAAGAPSNLQTLNQLGWTINGVEIIEETFVGDIPGDQNGGDQGPPIENQHFGDIHRIRGELSSFDFAQAELVSQRIAPSSGYGAGLSQNAAYPAGMMMKSNNLGFRVLLLPLQPNPNNSPMNVFTFPRNYLFGIPRTGIQRNLSSRYSRYVVEFECHDVSGALWNTTTD
jgi:hypothetical protein